jgi:hypothetical protein
MKAKQLQQQQQLHASSSNTSFTPDSPMLNSIMIMPANNATLSNSISTDTGTLPVSTAATTLYQVSNI